MEDLNKAWEYVIFPIIALVGGVVKYLQSILRGKQFSWVAFSIECLTALFLGLLITLIGKDMNASSSFIGACSGLGGWMGADFVKHLIRTYTKLPLPDDKKEK